MRRRLLPPGYFRCCSPFKKRLKGMSETEKLCSVASVNIYKRHFYDKIFIFIFIFLFLSFGCTLALLK